MSAHIIDGKALAAQIQNQLKTEIELELKSKNQPIPTLAVILVGEHPASVIYVNNKKNACKAVGMHLLDYALPESTLEIELLDLIKKLNADPQVNGILVQLPLTNPIKAIHPLKDVDGFHPLNIGRLAQGRPSLRPCTPYGIMTLLAHINFQFQGAHAVIVGTSPIVGLPMALELLMQNMTITLCHRFTEDLPMQVQQADLLIVAVGKPQLIKGAWIKPGATIIDVGITRLANGQILGDVEFEEAQTRAAFITPVPGGVGPMTVATLLQNTLRAMRLQNKPDSP